MACAWNDYVPGHQSTGASGHGRGQDRRYEHFRLLSSDIRVANVMRFQRRAQRNRYMNDTVPETTERGC